MSKPSRCRQMKNTRKKDFLCCNNLFLLESIALIYSFKNFNDVEKATEDCTLTTLVTRFPKQNSDLI